MEKEIVEQCVRRWGSQKKKWLNSMLDVGGLWNLLISVLDVGVSWEKKQLNSVLDVSGLWKKKWLNSVLEVGGSWKEKWLFTIILDVGGLWKKKQLNSEFVQSRLIVKIYLFVLLLHICLQNGNHYDDLYRKCLDEPSDIVAKYDFVTLCQLEI